MTDDRQRWDARHAANDAEPGAPDAAVVHWVTRFGAGCGRALDLASGLGRHALWLAAMGYEAEAWDVSPVALARLARWADVRGVSVRTRALDLVTTPLPSDALGVMDWVVVVDFLDRPLLADVHRLLVPGGRLVVATFTDDAPGPHPSARFRLRRGELSGGLPGLGTVEFTETRGRAALLAQRLPARGPSAGSAEVGG